MILLASFRYVVNAFSKSFFYNAKIELKIILHSLFTEQFEFIVGVRTFYVMRY